MIRSLHGIAGPRVGVVGGKLAVLPPTPEPKQDGRKGNTRSAIVDSGDGQTSYVTLAGLMRITGLSVERDAIDIAAYNGFGLAYHRGSGKFRVPNTYLAKKTKKAPPRSETPNLFGSEPASA